MSEQRNVAINQAIDCVFFEDNDLCYNYRTGKWTRIPAFNGMTYYTKSTSTGIIGQVVKSGNSVDLQDATSGVASTAILTTQEADPNEGGRAVTLGVRPLVNGGTVTVRVGTRNDQDDAVSFTSAISLNSRTKKADFLKEGRYHRAEITITGGFTTAMGADIEFRPAGNV